MKHYIIVKFAETVTDKVGTLEEISQLFSRWRDYPFLTGCELCPNVIDRSNRFDLLIRVELAREDLPLWDDCALHKRWKADFAHIVGAKTIIDCQ